MPMFLFCRNVHDIAHADDLLVRFCGDDTLAGSDKQHLIAAMDVHFRAPALKLTMARLKLLLISGVSSVCRVTGPPVNKGLFAGSAGIASGLRTFSRTSSFQTLVFHATLNLTLTIINLASPYPVAGEISSPVCVPHRQARCESQGANDLPMSARLCKYPHALWKNLFYLTLMAR
jgi:hypothetical protein